MPLSLLRPSLLRPSLHRLVGFICLGGSLGISLGCSSDTTGPGPVDAAHLYYQLTLNHHAITMALTAPYNTLQLTATPQSATGAILTDTSTTTYKISYDNAQCGCKSITISPTGLLTADSADGGVMIVASRAIGGITLTDSAYVNINAVLPVPVFTTLTFEPPPGRSLQAPVNGRISILPTPLDADGNEIENVLFFYWVPQDPEILIFSNPIPSDLPLLFFVPIREQVWVYVDVTIYGVRKVDSAQITVTAPVLSQIGVLPSTPAGSRTAIGHFSPGDDTVAVGATVFWTNQLPNLPIDVVFDNPSAVASGDSLAIMQNFGDTYAIPNDGGGNIASWRQQLDTTGTRNNGSPRTSILAHARSFPTAGTFPYHSTIYGTKGVIHVVTD